MSEEKQQTKQRLLDAAEVLFAEKGFDGVSIRELASAADVNVAAVNYHYQGKQNLYREVILRRFTAQRDNTLTALDRLLADAAGRPRLDQVIRTLVDQYFHGALSGPNSSSFLNLVAREMHSGECQHNDELFTEMIAPVFAAFSRALVSARPGLEREQISWIIASVVAQIHHFILRWKKRQTIDPASESYQIIMRALPALGLPLDAYIDAVAEHITRFSSAAIDTLYPEVTP